LYYIYTPKSVATPEAFAAALTWLADQPRMMIVRGAVKPGLDLSQQHLRRFADPDPANNSFVTKPRAWLPLDFDGLYVPPGLGAGDKVAEVGAYARSMLPPALADVTCVAVATASTGLEKHRGIGPGGKDSAHLRLFFLLDRATSDDALEKYVKGVNFERRLGLDASVLRTIQPVYTARPFFVNMSDPVPSTGCVMVLPGSRMRAVLDPEPYIKITALEQYKQKARRRARAAELGRTNGRVWRAILDDDLGVIDSYHETIWCALGLAVAVGASDEEIIEYTLAAIHQKADRARILRYDNRYLSGRIQAFRRRHARK
jgi:hypothetical protein